MYRFMSFEQYPQCWIRIFIFVVKKDYLEPMLYSKKASKRLFKTFNILLMCLSFKVKVD